MIRVSPARAKRFRSTIWGYYKRHKRKFSWRSHISPYRILVSEIMLQQTQVSRVSKKFPEFLKVFPDLKTLAKASTGKLLGVWQGMGYNRRALYLRETARIIRCRFGGKIPENPELLETLPGIGKATSCSVVTFAWDRPTIFIETNIRRVFINFFFGDKQKVHDRDIKTLVEQTLPDRHFRDWYYALMDYGTKLAETTNNPNRKSVHYRRQQKFEGSLRKLRGILIRKILEKPQDRKDLYGIENYNIMQINNGLFQLEQEGFVKEHDGTYIIK